jgi:hypothetical protein
MIIADKAQGKFGIGSKTGLAWHLHGKSLRQDQ